MFFRKNGAYRRHATSFRDLLLSGDEKETLETYQREGIKHGGGSIADSFVVNASAPR